MSVVVHARPASSTAVARNLHDVRERMARAAERAGREPGAVTLVGVTKTVPIEVVREALDAGLSCLGENRIQEALPKMRALADRAPTWHFIGHLQTNKARKAAELFDRLESVDSLRLGEALESAVEETGRELRLFVQVRVGDEPGKGGVELAELERLVDGLDALPSLRVTGLMSIPPPRRFAEESRADFRLLRRAFEGLASTRPAMRHLSMGMSSDFEVAIEEGATEVRVGTALFGTR